MEIIKNQNGTETIVSVEGRLDTNTSPELEEALSQEYGTAEKLVLDFSKLEYISSAGLRVMLLAHKAMSPKGGLKITGVNDMVKEIFDVTGFAQILDIE